MATITEPSREIPVAVEVDVVVVGGGCAGVSAALAAARSGAKTALVERLGFLGGCATATMMDVFWMFRAGPQIPAVEGVGMEVLRRLKERGGVDGEPGCRAYVDSEMLKVLYDDMMKEAGVDLWFHTLGVRPIQEGNAVKGVIIESKSGRQAILAKAVVDASGDGDIAWQAGAAYEMGRPADGKVQPVSTSFRLANVDLAAFQEYIRQNPDELSLRKIIAQARAAGDYDVPREYMSLHGIRPWGDFTGINATRVHLEDPTDVKQFTVAEIECRRQVYAVADMLRKYAPGFANCEVAAIATQAAARESRRFIGGYVLSQQDILTGARFPDAVAVSPCFTDIHNPAGPTGFMPFPAHPVTGESMYRECRDSGDPDSNWDTYTRGASPVKPHKMDPKYQPTGTLYDIPYRTLVPLEIDRLLTAGRCISCDNFAAGSVRYFSVSFATGEAAGLAAALSAEQGIVPRQLDVRELQTALVASGGYLRPELTAKL